MRSRMVILTVALLLGLLAAVLTGRYLDSLQRGVAAEDEPIEVLVAQDDLPRGMSSEELIQNELIVRQSIPRRYVADGAVSAVSSIEGQVLSEGVSKGEQVTQARFRFASDAGLSYSVPADHVAISISNDAVKGVAGLVKPGDHVMVVVTLDPGPAGEALTQILLEKARVLAVGTAIGAEPAPAARNGGGGGLVGNQAPAEEAAPASTITLALLPADVEKLVYAEEKGNVWLALLSSGDVEIAPTLGRTITNVLED